MTYCLIRKNYFHPHQTETTEVLWCYRTKEQADQHCNLLNEWVSKYLGEDRLTNTFRLPDLPGVPKQEHWYWTPEWTPRFEVLQLQVIA